MNMKNIYKIFGSMFFIFLLVGCDEDFSDNNEFAKNIAPPSNVSASFDITQDNTGDVTITPTGEGAISFVIDYGDGSPVSSSIKSGGSVKHTFKEGNHTIKVTATGLNNLTTTADVSLTVSFNAPENLQVTIENDEVTSKKVNVTATADWATVFDFIPGEAGADPVTANIGETASFTYKEAGTYTIKVVARGAAIATTEFSQEFEVTAILAPAVSAPTQPDRPSSTVVSIFSDKYSDIAGTDFYPWWWQSTQYEEYDLNGDKMIKYSKVNYQGVQFAESQDVSGMEFMHIDVWTASPEFENLEISLISASNGEKPVLAKLNQDEWTSFDIPLTDWTDQGLTIADMHQLKFAINPYNGDGAGVIFLDNIYFWKANSVGLPIYFDNEEPFKGVGGASFELSTDPEDSSNKTGKVTNGGNDWETAELILDEPIKVVSGADNKYSVKIYNPTADTHELMMKLEQSGDNEFIELKQNFSAKGWNNLTFDFSTVTSQAWPNPGAAWDGTADFKKLVFFIDGGKKDTGTYHIDDIIKGEPVVNQAVFDDFEGNGTIAWVEDAAGKSVVDNPNGSGKVLKYEDTGGQYANIRFDLAADHSKKFDLTTNNIFTFKIYIPSSGVTGSSPNQVSVKLQDGSKSAPWEGQFEVVTPLVLDQWQSVLVDFSEKASSTEFSRIVFQVNGENNSDNVTAYIDDFYYEVPQAHDDFEGNGNIPAWAEDAAGMSTVDNPYKETINTSNKVMKYEDTGGQYANVRFDLDAAKTIKFDLTNANKVSVDVYVPSGSITGSQDNKLWIKLQDGSKDRPWEGQVTKEKAIELDKWQRLEFDFSDQKDQTAFSRLLLQFNGENNNDQVTAYIDNLFIHR